MKKIVLAAALLLCSVGSYAEAVVSYARKNQNVTLDLNWTSANYGTVQWQKSNDGGTSWVDISGATSPQYTFKITSDGLYRACVKGDPACPDILLEREVKVVDFSVDVVSSTSSTVDVEVSDVDLAGVQVVEYGYCANFSSLQRPYEIMNRVKVGEQLPAGDTFDFTCTDLRPNETYSVRVYFKTADGSVIYGPGKLASTIEGLEWSSEDWTIEKQAIGARFALVGSTSDSNPNVKFWLGSDANSLSEYTVTDLGDHKYSAQVDNLVPNTPYLAVVTAEIDGEEVRIEKQVKTLSDYSNVVVDETVKPVTHTILWDKTKRLTQLSPEGQQVEYPRMCRVDENKILLMYHGSRGADQWSNIYLRKSYDNGVTWTEPVILFDKEQSNFGSHYWRIVNPEMIRLQNGWILMTCVGNGNPETNENCHVLACVSKDGGETWGDPIIVGRGRTWEPQVVQLPNGELELFVSSEAKWYPGANLYQEIVFARSTDNGLTWTELKRCSYNPNCRDGMPCALVMQGNKGILFTIECVNGSPSPSVLHRGLNEEWESGDWDRVQDDRRWGTPISGGGAPYCLQLPTGEIVVSSHAGGTGVWQTGRPRIVVGDNTGHNFTSAVTPLAGTSPLPSNTGAYYNSMFLKDNETVWLLITKAEYNGNTRENSAIMCLEGKIVEKQ